MNNFKGNVASLTTLEESRVSIIGGEAMPPHFIDWNFVSSRKERIEQVTPIEKIMYLRE